MYSFVHQNKIDIMTSQDNMEMIRQSAKDFAETHIRPKMMEWDEDQFFPVDTMRLMGQQGFLGVLVPE